MSACGAHSLHPLHFECIRVRHRFLPALAPRASSARHLSFRPAGQTVVLTLRDGSERRLTLKDYYQRLLSPWPDGVTLAPCGPSR